MTEVPEDELTEYSHGRRPLEVEREQSQGVEVFEDPDATLPAGSLIDGSPGHEGLTGDAVGLEPDEQEEHPAGPDEEHA
jgi:hypothetical protein